MFLGFLFFRNLYFKFVLKFIIGFKYYIMVLYMYFFKIVKCYVMCYNDCIYIFYIIVLKGFFFGENLCIGFLCILCKGKWIDVYDK